MVTIFILLTIIFNAILGTLPLLGPVIAGMVSGIIVGIRDLALVIAFWGAVIGGVFARIFLNFPENSWHKYLLNLFGQQAAHQTEIIFKGSLFYLVLYFGLAGVSGAYLGVLLKNSYKKSKN